MRVAFFLLVLANLCFFAWAQGYFGGREEGREPQRLKEQIQPEKMKVVVTGQPVVAPPAPSAPTAQQQACRRIDGLAAADAEHLQKTLLDAGLAATVKSIEEAPSYWVHIPALPDKAAADKKLGELKQRGITDFQVMQTGGSAGLVISLGLFSSEGAANEFLLGLNKKGVRSARIEARAKPPAQARLEVRGATDLVAKRLPELLAGTVGVTAADCQ